MPGWLQTGARHGQVQVYAVGIGLVFAPLRADERFSELLRLMKLKP